MSNRSLVWENLIYLSVKQFSFCGSYIWEEREREGERVSEGLRERERERGRERGRD